MIEHIKDKIKLLEYELKAIDKTNKSNNLTLHNYEKKRRLDIICKIQVLNEVILSYE